MHSEQDVFLRRYNQILSYVFNFIFNYKYLQFLVAVSLNETEIFHVKILFTGTHIPFCY